MSMTNTEHAATPPATTRIAFWQTANGAYSVTVVRDTFGLHQVTDTLGRHIRHAQHNEDYAREIAAGLAETYGATEVLPQMASPLAPAAQVASSNLATKGSETMPTDPQGREMLAATRKDGLPIIHRNAATNFRFLQSLVRRGWAQWNEGHTKTMVMITDNGAKAAQRWADARAWTL
jgi:hypothetical protein